MQTLILILTIVISLSLGGFFGYKVGNNKFANLQEDIISNEFRLLELAKNVKPNCESINTLEVYPLNNDVFVVFLIDGVDNKVLRKVVFDKEGHTATEEIQNSCR